MPSRYSPQELREQKRLRRQRQDRSDYEEEYKQPVVTLLELTSLRHRFWGKVILPPHVGTSECWLWKGPFASHGGYGVFAVRHHLLTASRVSWMISNARDIPQGRWVLHTCDTPSCCNPDHLYLGDHADNVRDMVERGRAHNGQGQ